MSVALLVGLHPMDMDGVRGLRPRGGCCMDAFFEMKAGIAQRGVREGFEVNRGINAIGGCSGLNMLEINKLNVNTG